MNPFPNASKSFLALNPEITGAGKAAELEPAPRARPLAKSAPKEVPSEPVFIRIVSVRKRLLDPDNISEKWALDALRYCGAIHGDEPDKITLETSQRKAEKGEEEHTLIEIFEL